MLLLAAASVLAATPFAGISDGARHRTPTVRATGFATVRLVTARVIHWNPPKGLDQPAMRPTTIIVDGRLAHAKLVEFQ